MPKMPFATGESSALSGGAASMPPRAVLYTPFVSKDMIHQALGMNLVREANGKPLLELVVQNDQSAAKLQQLIEQELQIQEQKFQNYRAAERKLDEGAKELSRELKCSLDEARKIIGAEEINNVIEGMVNAKRRIDVLRQMEVRSNENGVVLGLLRPEYDKIYIIGHGAAGMDVLAADQEGAQGKVTAADVAQQFLDGGLPRDFRDIRVISCYSADARRPISFSPSDLQLAAQVELGAGPSLLNLYGLFGSGQASRQPFAQSLSDALFKLGYGAAKVTGYHGLGGTYSVGYRVRRLRDQTGEQIGSNVRASSVRRVFSQNGASQSHYYLGGKEKPATGAAAYALDEEDTSFGFGREGLPILQAEIEAHALFYQWCTERNLLAIYIDDGIEIRSEDGGKQGKTFYIEGESTEASFRMAEHFIVENYRDFALMPDRLYLMGDNILSQDGGRTRILARNVDGYWDVLPETDMMSIEEFKAGAAVKGKMSEEGYQRVLSALAEYHEVARSVPDTDSLYIEKLTVLHEQVSGYILGHPDSGRLPAMASLLDQVNMRITEIGELAFHGESIDKLSSFSYLYDLLTKTSLRSGRHIYLDAEGNFVTRGKGRGVGMRKWQGGQSVVDRVKATVAAEYGQEVADKVFSTLAEKDLSRNGKGIDLAGLKKVHLAIEHQLSPVSATLYLWVPDSLKDFGHAALQIGHGRKNIEAVDIASFNKDHYVSWWSTVGVDLSIRTPFDKGGEAKVKTSLEDDMGKMRQSHDMVADNVWDKIKAAQGVDPKWALWAEGAARVLLNNPAYVKGSSIPFDVYSEYFNKFGSRGVDQESVVQQFAEKIRQLAKDSSDPEVVKKRLDDVADFFSKRTKDFKNGAPNQERVFRINLEGLDVAAMQAEWQRIRGSSDKHFHILFENCSSMVAKVLKAGGADKLIGHAWRPALGIWTPDELFKFGQTLQKAQAAIVARQRHSLDESLVQTDTGSKHSVHVEGGANSEGGVGKRTHTSQGADYATLEEPVGQNPEPGHPLRPASEDETDRGAATKPVPDYATLEESVAQSPESASLQRSTGDDKTVDPLGRQWSVDSESDSDTPMDLTAAKSKGRTDFIQELLRRDPALLERYAVRKHAGLQAVFDYVYRGIDPDGKFARITGNFISKKHFLAFSLAASIGNFAVSAREAGGLTLERLSEGAAAKGHDILEKTVKSSSLIAAYGAEGAQQKLRVLSELGLAGFVGHWGKEGLLGLYVTKELYELRSSADPEARAVGERVRRLEDGHYLYPIDMSDAEAIRSSTDALRGSPQWQQKVFTGDYDLHDMLSFSGRAHSVPSGSLDERSIRNMLNAAVEAVDGSRSMRRGSHHTVQHGPQVSYPAHMGSNEKGVPLVGVVARPSFPLALCDRGVWTIVENDVELQAAYKKMGARLKETWRPEGHSEYKDDAKGHATRERRPSQESPSGEAEPKGRSSQPGEGGGVDEGANADTSRTVERKPVSDAGDAVAQPAQDEPSRRNALEQLAATQLDGERLSQRWFDQVEALKRKNRLGAEWEAVGGIETDADGTARQRFVNTQDGSDTRLAIAKKHQQLFNDFAAYTKEQAKQIRLQRRENIRDAVGGVFGLAMNTFSLVQTLRDVNPMNQGLGVLGQVPRTPVEIAAQVQVYTQLVQTPVSYVDDGKQLLDAIRALRGGAVKSSLMFGKVVPVVSLVLDTVNLAAMATEFHNEKDPERRKVLAANIGVSVIGSGLAIAGLTAGALAASTLVSVAVAAAAAAVASAIGWIALPVAAVGMAITYAVQYFSGQAEKFNEVKKEFDLLLSDISKKGFSKRDGVWQVGTGVVSELNLLTGKMRYGRVRVTPTTVTGLSRPGGMDHVRSHAMERGGTLTMDEQIEIERKGVSPELYQRMRARDVSMLDVYDAFGVEQGKEYDHEIGDVDSAILLPSNPDVDLVLTVGAIADKRYVDGPAFKALRDKYGERFVWMFHQWGIGTDYSFTEVASEFTRKNVVVTLDAKARTLIVPALQGKQVGYMKYTLRGNGGAYALVLSSSLPEIHIEASSQATELWTIDISQASHQYVGAITAAGAAVEYQRLANKAAQNGNTLSDVELAEYNLYRERMGRKYFASRRNVFADLRIMREQVSFGGQILNLDGRHAPRLMLVDNVADGIRLQLVLDFAQGTKVSASIYIDEDSPLDPGEFNKLLQYFSWSGLDKYLRYHSSEVMVRGKWSGSLNILDGTGFLVRDQSRLWNGSEEHEILWIKDRETAPYRSSIPGAIEQVTKLEDRYRLSGSFTPPTGQDKGRFVFETPRLADIRRAELGALPGLQCRELHMGRHPGFFNSLLNGWDWRPRWQRPDAAQLARHVREDFPTFYGEFSEGAVIEGVNEQGQTLQLHFVDGGLELRAASWQRDGATYHYLDEAGAATWYLVEGGRAETVSLLESDLQTLPLRHHESPAILLRLTAATHTLRVSEYWQNIAPISIILADRPGLNIIVDGHKNLLRWERDGNDVLLMNRGKTVLKLLDALAPGQRLALAYTQLQFDGVTVSLQDVLTQREQCDATIREISPSAQGLEGVRQRLAPQLRAKPGQLAWQEVSLPAVVSIGLQTQQLMSGVSLRQGDEPAVWLDEGVQINAEWLGRLLEGLSAGLEPRASASEPLAVKVYGKGVVGLVDMTRRQSYIADSAKSRTWINGHVVAGELAPVWLAGSVLGYRGKHPLGQFIASGRDSQGWQLQALDLAGNSAFLSLLRELRVGNQAQVLADWLQRSGFEGRFAIGGMVEGINAQGQRLRYQVGERIELIFAEWQREGLQHVYQKQTDGSWSYLIEGGAARRVTIHARDLQLPARGDGNVTALLKLTAATRELVLEDGSVPGGLSIWQPDGEGLTLYCAGRREDWQWRQEGYDVVLQRNGQPEIRWLNLRKPHVNKQKPRALWTHQNFADYETPQDEKSWSGAQLQFDGQRVGLTEFIGAVSGGIPTPDLGQPAVLTVDGENQERVTLRAGDIVLPEQEGPKPVQLYLGKATKQVLIAEDWPEDAPVYLASTAEQPLAVQWLGQPGDMHWMRDADDLVLMQGGREKLRWQELLAADRQAARQHASLQWARARLALADYPPSVQIANGMLFGRDVDSGRLTIWLAPMIGDDVWDEVSRYFSSEEDRAVLAGGLLHITGAWQGEIDVARGKGLLVKSQGDHSIVRLWGRGEPQRELSLPGHVSVWHDANGGFGFAGVRLIGYGPSRPTVRFKASGFIGETLLADELEFVAPVDTYRLFDAAEGKHAGGVVGLVTAGARVQVHAGSALRLVNSSQQSLVLTVTEAGVALQSATWQRGSAAYSYRKAEDGAWVCRIDSGKEAKLELRPADLRWLPATDHQGLRTELSVSAETRELVLGGDYGCVTLAQADWTGLTVQWTGSADNLSWRRVGDNLQLLQGEQIKIQWQGLSPVKRAAGRCWFRLAGHTIDLLNYPPKSRIADGAMLAGSVAEPEVWISETGDAQASLKQIWDFFAVEGRQRPQSGSVRIRGQWNGELDLTRGLALLVGTQTEDEWSSEQVVLKWRSNGVSSQSRFGWMEGDVLGEVVRHESGQLRYQGLFHSLQCEPYEFQFVAEESSGFEAGAVTLREIRGEGLSASYFSDKLGSRSEVVNALNELGCGFGLADEALITLKTEQGATREYLVSGARVELKRVERADGKVCGHSADLLRQAMCSLHAAGDSEGVLPNLSRHKEELSLTMPI